MPKWAKGFWIKIRDSLTGIAATEVAQYIVTKIKK